MVTTRTETITAHDGGTFDAHVALPGAGSGPAILVIQEIGGVNGYIRAVAERLADMGYVALAPDAFWRVQPNFSVESFTEANMAECMRVAGQYDPEQGLADLGAALERLRELPEVTGGVGVVGFCFGGTMAFQVAAEYDLEAAVSYYGSGVAAAIDRVDQVECPLLFHFGGQDPFLPSEDVETIRSATSSMANIEVLVQPDAGHAFDNHLSENFWNPDAAGQAWTRTTAFLSEHLPVT
ncbi:MAG: dienelactone hydrolase family protein [Acidimicrobiales bacterium]